MNRQKAKAFQFTPLREGRHVGETAVAQHTLFQFTPLREGRLGTMGSRLLWSIFQFTPLREGRRVLLPSPSPSFYFNSRPSARGDSACCLQVHALTAFQFTPLREGRRPALDLKPIGSRISIHAPPRGATLYHALKSHECLFQFTPLREGRPYFCKQYSTKAYFNSRPSARGDTVAPFTNSPAFNFNSRPSARGDRKRYAISANLLFNPYKSAWLNNRATQFVEIILVIFHRIIA